MVLAAQQIVDGEQRDAEIPMLWRKLLAGESPALVGAAPLGRSALVGSPFGLGECGFGDLVLGVVVRENELVGGHGARWQFVGLGAARVAQQDLHR